MGNHDQGQINARRSLIAVGAALLLGALTPVTAQAGSMNQRVAIGVFRGPQAARVQDAVEGALLRRYFLVPDSEVAAAARKSGVRLQRDQDFAEVARSLNVQAFVTATVKKQRNWTVQMVVRKGATGEAVGRYDFSERKIETLAAAIARSTPRRLQTVLSPKAAAAPRLEAEAEPEGEIKTSAPSLPVESPEYPDDAVAPRPFFEFAVGARMFSRTMSYVDNFSGLPGYRLARASAMTADMAFHPLALIPGAGTLVSGFGLTGGVTYAVGVGTQGTSAGPARTEVYGYEAGVRQRIPVKIVDLIPHVGYMQDVFVASGAELAPDVRYRVVRAGLGMRLAFSDRAAVRGSADYLHVLDAGPLTGDRFPRATVQGVDLNLGAGYMFTDTLEAQVSVGLRRYGFDMKVQQGDTLIAGGAVDEYMSMTVGVAYRPSLRRRP
jgi:hypothetical protein